LLERAALDALAIARKAGLVAMGFGKVEAVLAREPVIALIHAAEAAPNGITKLNAALRQSRQAGSTAVIRILSMAQLDLALGRPNVVHAALLAGPASENFMARLRRLECFRTGEPGELGDPPETHKDWLKSVS